MPQPDIEETAATAAAAATHSNVKKNHLLLSISTTTRHCSRTVNWNWMRVSEIKVCNVPNGEL